MQDRDGVPVKSERTIEASSPDPSIGGAQKIACKDQPQMQTLQGLGHNADKKII